MAQRLVESLAGLVEELADGDIVDLQSECEGIDKHTHRVGNLQVGASAAHRTKINLAVVGVARYDVGRGSEEKVCRSNFLLAAECAGLLEIGWADSFADKSLLFGLGQIGRNLAGSFAGLQLLGKELLCCLECIAILGFLLIGHEIEVGVVFFLYSGTIEHLAYLTDKQVGRTTVEDEVVYIHQQ